MILKRHIFDLVCNARADHLPRPSIAMRDAFHKRFVLAHCRIDMQTSFVHINKHERANKKATKRRSQTAKIKAANLHTNKKSVFIVLILLPVWCCMRRSQHNPSVARFLNVLVLSRRRSIVVGDVAPARKTEPLVKDDR